jgi:leucine dehydrogenase
LAVEILDTLAREAFEEVIALHDRHSGVRAFLAIHDTRRGPAFGGIRRWSYLDEEQALRDCLRLARSMTYKCAMAGLDAGGAKLVLLDRPDLDLALAYRYIGDVVERLGGRVYAGPDVGSGVEELGWVAERTRFATDPGPDGPGELAHSTSAGVVAGIAAALRHLDGSERWRDRTAVVQGLGQVGSGVAGSLRALGARVLAGDTDSERGEALARGMGVEWVDPCAELELACDVLAPCALGGIVHDLSLQRLRCRVLAGSANNVLAASGHGDRLHERGILYVPDFVVNSGALIRGALFHMEGVRVPVAEIGDRIAREVELLLGMAADEGLPPARVAVREAERRIRATAAGAQN